jgi:hypothetical protein
MPYAVSEQMIEAWGEVIFDLSLNKQTRRGDPIRLLDHAAWARQREQTGLSDPEIADKTGLACEQVTFIRNIVERRRFRLDQYRKLFRLGGGLRHREDRYEDPAEKFELSEAAKELRQCMQFPQTEITRFVAAGHWTSQTLLDLLDEGDFHSDVVQAARGLLAGGLGRGEVIVGDFADQTTNLSGFFATVMAGGVYLPLPADTSAEAIAQHARAHAVLTELPTTDATPDLQGRRPAAADPALLLLSPSSDATPRLAIHTHQTVLCAVAGEFNAIADLMTGEACEILSTTVPGSETREDGRQVRGPALFAGYLNNPEADAARRTADGWFIS